MRTIRLLPILAAASCWAAPTTAIPNSPVALSALNSAGTSFVYPGVLSGNVTLTLNASGQPCLQEGVYCTNPAGVVIVAGSSGVGQATSFSATYAGTSGTWQYGSVLMSISGVGTVQLFPANTADGLASPSPSPSLTITSQTLSSLGFGTFSVTNPTVTIFIADTLYTDNSGSYTVSGSFGLTGTPTAAPALSGFGMVLLALLLAASGVILRRRVA